MKRVRLLTVAALVAATIVAVPSAAAGAAPVNWSDHYPTSGSVTIPQGQKVVLDVDLDLTQLTIHGVVQCGSQSVTLRTQRMLVRSNGTFRCGTAAKPFTKRLTITLTGAGSGDHHGYGNKYVAVEGRFELHGKPTESWTRLATTARQGDSTIKLAKGVWKPGDRIVLAPTNFWLEQVEERTVVARSGKTLTLDAPLDREHYCGKEKHKGEVVRECAEVGLLTRNITVQGDASSANTKVGGHLIAVEGSTVKIEHSAFQRMGQLGRLARYPIHFHLAEDMSGSYVKHTAITNSYNRFMSIHRTHNLLVKRVVGNDTIGHGFYLEDGIETGNRLIKNLAVAVRPADAANAVTPSDVQASAYWISNPDNDFICNVAAGADFAGFWLGFPEHPLGLSEDPTIWPRRTPLGEFRDNVAHTVGFAGLYLDGGERPDRTTETTWYNPRRDPSDNNSPHVVPVLDGFVAYKSRHYGIWLRTFSGVKVTGAKLVNNWRSIYLANIPSGPTRDNVGVVTDSLLMGVTKNKGQAEGWEVTDPSGHTVPKHWDPESPLGGISFYDGPMTVRNTTMVNFDPDSLRDAGALSSLFPNPFNISVQNKAKNITFKNSKRVLFPDVDGTMDGDSGTLFTDIDGSVTGIKGAEVVVRGALLDDGSCTTKGAWNAHVCQNSPVRVLLIREDGGSSANTQYRGNRSVHWQGSPGNTRTAVLNYLGGPQHRVDFDGSDTNDFTLILDEQNGPKAARLAIPVTTDHFTMWISGVQNPLRGSLADLKSGPSGYWYDAANNVLHVRLVGEGTVATFNPA